MGTKVGPPVPPLVNFLTQVREHSIMRVEQNAMQQTSPAVRDCSILSIVHQGRDGRKMPRLYNSAHVLRPSV
jgi:hypothetical protein